jgi:pseudaminic acid cytidylyltransferase
MKSVCVIPARGGSKRIPHKNVKDFFGRPMISYSISAALESKVFDRVIVSTDDDQIRRVAIECGAEVPFVRPPDISDDFTPLAGVLTHSLKWLESNGSSYDAVCCVLATAPFVSVGDLQEGRRLLSASSNSAVIPVTSFPFPIFRALKIAPSGVLEMVWPEHELTRSNDLPETFHDAGQFYWLRVDSFLNSNRIYARDALPLLIPRWRVQDIDTLEDWSRAEKIYASTQGGRG